jgi:hypothetical protein
MAYNEAMASAAIPPLYSAGLRLDTSEQCFGQLRSSIDVVDDAIELRKRMEEDGYLFLPGYLDRAEVARARHAICEELMREGTIDPAYPVDLAIAREGASTFRPDIANSCQPLHALIYGQRMMDFYSFFLGGQARHYDFTWMRTVAPGKGSEPHCDIVFMGRGTPSVYTAWVPLGDIPLQTGGLIILENSHRDEELRRTYCSMDVDTSCENKDAQSQVNAGGYPGFGALSKDPIGLRQKMGGRWLTSEFQMGDLLTFPMFTVHASLDNQSKEIRLSSDSRYQLASEPIDERWIGEHPPGHGGKMVKGMIC